MAMFYQVSTMMNGAPLNKAFYSQEHAERAFRIYSTRAPTVWMLQPQNHMLDSSGDGAVVKKVREAAADAAAAAAAGSAAVYMMVIHVGHLEATIFRSDDAPSAEAEARRAFAHIPACYAKALWRGGSRTATASSGEEGRVWMCSDFAHVVLSTTTHGISPRTPVSAPPNTIKPAYWIVGSAKDNVADLKAYATEGAAKRAFDSAAARGIAVMVAEPSNIVKNSAGDDAEVEAVLDVVTATAANVTHVVARHVGHAEAKMYTSDDGEIVAFRYYDAISKNYAKAIWGAQSTTAMATYGMARWSGYCSDLARAILSSASDVGAPPTPVKAVPDVIKTAYWIVGCSRRNLKAYASQGAAERAFNNAAAQGIAVMVAQPSNDMSDSAGDAAEVEQVLEAVTAAAANTAFVVVRHGGFAEANMHTSHKEATSEFQAISENYTKVLWGAKSTAAMATHGTVQRTGFCNDLARAILAVAAATEDIPFEDGSLDAGEPLFWVVCTAFFTHVTTKAYDSLSYAAKVYRMATVRGSMAGAVLMSEPGHVVLMRSGDPDQLSLCDTCVRKAVSTAGRVVVMRFPDRSEAFFYGHDEEAEAEDLFSRISARLPRVLWADGHDEAIKALGAAEGIEAASVLAKHILRISEKRLH